MAKVFSTKITDNKRRRYSLDLTFDFDGRDQAFLELRDLSKENNWGNCQLISCKMFKYEDFVDDKAFKEAVDKYVLNFKRTKKGIKFYGGTYL